MARSVSIPAALYVTARRRVLAKVAGHLTELVEDLPLLRSPGLAVALIDGLDVLPFRVRTHAGCLHRPGTVTSPMARRFPLSNILDGAIRMLDRSPFPG